MKRKIEQWRNCDPRAMVMEQSQAALIFAMQDAKADILELHDALRQLTYLRDCIEAGIEPAMSEVNAAIARASGGLGCAIREQQQRLGQFGGVL